MDFLLPIVLQSSSVVGGAKGASSRRNVLHSSVAICFSFSTAFKKIMSALMAVLNFIAAISSPTFLIVLCKSDSTFEFPMFGFRKPEFNKFGFTKPPYWIRQTLSKKRRMPTTPSGFHG